MSSLGTRVEILKLAEALDVEPSELHGLDDVSADDLRALRHAHSEALFARHEARFRRIAKLASAVPAALSARIAQLALTPLLGARVAAVMEPGLAVKLADSLDVDYLADLSAVLDPVRAEPIIVRIPPATITKVGARLVQRGAHVALGRFVSVIDPETALRVVEGASGRDLLQVALFADDRDALDTLVQRIDDDRLLEAMEAAHQDGLYDDAVTLVGNVGPATRERLVAMAGRLPVDGVRAFVEALHRFDVWDSLDESHRHALDEALTSS